MEKTLDNAKLIQGYLEHLQSKRKPSFLDKFIDARKGIQTPSLPALPTPLPIIVPTPTIEEASPIETIQKKAQRPDVFDKITALTDKYFHSHPELREDRYADLNYFKRFNHQAYQDLLKDRKGGKVLHDQFLQDFYEMYKFHYHGEPTPLVNGFGTDTWYRISGLRANEIKAQKEYIATIEKHQQSKKERNLVLNYSDVHEISTDDLIARMTSTLSSTSPSETKRLLDESDLKKMDKIKHLGQRGEIIKIIEILSKPYSQRSALESKTVEIYLRQLPAFKTLPDFVVSDVSKHLVIEKYNSNEVIESQGQPAKKWYVCLQGMISITLKRGQNAKPLLVDLLHAGESFGEEAMISDTIQYTNAIAQGNIVVARLEKADFRRLILPGYSINTSNSKYPRHPSLLFAKSRSTTNSDLERFTNHC